MLKPFEIALTEVGQKEIKGAKHNKKIVEYFQMANNSWVTDDETAWCAAFMAYCLEKAGLESTNKLNARSYLDWGEPTDKPKLGDIVVFWRGKKSGWQGHVGFYITERDGLIQVLGGNQSDQVNIQGYAKSKLLGYRKVPDTKKDTVSGVSADQVSLLTSLVRGLSKLLASNSK